MTHPALAPHATESTVPSTSPDTFEPASEQPVRSRDISLDGIKVLAALAVVVLHTTMNLVQQPDPHSEVWWVAELFNAATRWSVPAFVMVSGVLLLGGSHAMPLRDFYRQRMVRILIPLAFWSAVYLAYRTFTQPGFTPRDVVYTIVTGRPYYHLWYLYMIVGIYLVAPFVKQLTDNLSTTTIGWIAFVVLAWAALDIGVPYQSRTFFARSFPYIGYLLAGVWLHRRPLRMSSGWLVAVLVTTVLADALLTGLLAHRLGAKSVTMMEAEFNPVVIAMSVALFALLSRVRTVPAVVLKLSLLTLGIYVVHPLVLDGLEFVGLNGKLLHPLVGIPLTAALTFLLSSLIAWCLARVPLLRPTVC